MKAVQALVAPDPFWLCNDKKAFPSSPSSVQFPRLLHFFSLLVSLTFHVFFIPFVTHLSFTSNDHDDEQ